MESKIENWNDRLLIKIFDKQKDVAMFRIHFTYINKNYPSGDREFDALCHAVPRKGERVYPIEGGGGVGGGVTVVHDVAYKFVNSDNPSVPFEQCVNVLLRDETVEDRHEWPD